MCALLAPSPCMHFSIIHSSLSTLPCFAILSLHLIYPPLLHYYRSLRTSRNVVLLLHAGSRQDVNDDALLRKLGITHVIDCAASASRSRRPEGIKKENYLVLDADDNEKFPIIKVFFAKVKSFLDMAVKERGRVMVHCELGMNRSVTLCLAYKLASDRCKLFHAVREFSAGRPNILTNRGFRRQLIDFATQHNLI